jgi:hypothetical protein
VSWDKLAAPLWLAAFAGHARRNAAVQSGPTDDGPGEQEAQRLGHNYPGTEHALLGLIRGDGDHAGSRTLEVMGLSLECLRQQVEETIGQA